MSTSSEKPASISSRPDADSVSSVATRAETAVHASRATRASGDRMRVSPSRASSAITKPAPHRSSILGRSSSSGHLSPAATTDTTLVAGRFSVIHAATAGALRSDAPMQRDVPAFSCAEMVEPLGDGRTSSAGGWPFRRVPGGEAHLARPGLASPHGQHCTALAGIDRGRFVTHRPRHYRRPDIESDGQGGGEGQDIDHHGNIGTRRNGFGARGSPVESNGVRPLAMLSVRSHSDGVWVVEIEGVSYGDGPSGGPSM